MLILVILVPNAFSYSDAHRLATLYLKQTKGGTRPQQASDETKHTIKVHFSELVDIAFGSKGINFNAYGVKRMMLTYTKAFDALEHQKIKDKYFL